FQAEDGIRDFHVTGVQTCALPISGLPPLTSLVSHRADGGTDLDESTVAARLACYRRYAEDVPLEVIEQADHEARIKAFVAEKERSEERRVGKESRIRSVL